MAGRLGFHRGPHISMDEWAYEANCADKPTGLFFPEDDEDGKPPESKAAYKQAQRICEACPVQIDCLAYALETAQEWGMWGGLTPGRRRKLRRNAARRRIARWTAEEAAREAAPWLKKTS